MTQRLSQSILELSGKVGKMENDFGRLQRRHMKSVDLIRKLESYMERCHDAIPDDEETAGLLEEIKEFLYS